MAKAPVVRAGEEVVRTILEARRRPLAPPALAARLEPVIAEWIDAATRWEGLVFGESRCLVFDTRLAKDATFFIRFWSEPGTDLLCEIPSGRRDAALAKFFLPQAATWAESRGFRIEGELDAYRRNFPAETGNDIAAVARFVIDALVRMIDYQGTTRIVAALAHDYRWRVTTIHDVFSETEIARAFRLDGFRVEWIVDGSGEVVDPPAFRCTKHGVDTLVELMNPDPEYRLYGRVRFSTDLAMTSEQAAEHREAGAIPPDVEGMFGISAIHAFTGGVSDEWLLERVREWGFALREQRRALRRDRNRGAKPKTASGTVH